MTVTSLAAQRSGFADANDVRGVVDQMPDEYVECRELNHLWRPYDVHYNAKYHTYDRTLRCYRCLTRKHQELSERGHVLRSSYSYPEDYQLKNLGRIAGDARDVVRLASLTRQIKKSAAKRAKQQRKAR
jgi:hypothetical protein